MADNNNSGSSMQLNDILFVISRHKWKIAFCALVGLAAAAVLFYYRPPLYTSEAKLLIRYVTDTKTLDAGAENEIVRPVDSRGAAIFNSELELLLSEDALKEAAVRTGPSKILASYGGGTNVIAAARVLSRNLNASVPKNSAVIVVRLSHRKPEVAETALQHLIDEYLVRHVKVHLSEGATAALQSQTDQVSAALAGIERELRDAKSKAKVISLEQTKSDLARFIAQLRESLKTAQAEWAERYALITQYERASASSTNAPSTNAVVNLARYKKQAEKLARLKETETEMLTQYAETSKRVQQLRKQIEAAEKVLQDAGVDPEEAMQAATTSAANGREFDLNGEKTRLLALEARMKALQVQLEEVMAEAQKVNEAENSIVTLERKKAVAEDLYLYFHKTLERIKVDQAADTGKVNNISLVQVPSAALQDYKPLYKLMAAAFAGCVALGFGLAFVIDFVVDNSFRRPKEVEGALQIPVLVSIPSFGSNGHSKLKRRKSSRNTTVEIPGLEIPNGEIPPWDNEDPMLPYYEALRDRLVMLYGEDTHKPKIVGVTSCSLRSGVSRIATGLAASLSRDVERNVLLIGLERDKVSVSAFAKGRPALLNDVSETTGDGAPESEQVEANLKALATREKQTGGVSIVQSFSNLMPKLKTSDYDYVIFDLPPLTQTSGSLRLATQMEKTILVIEAERHSRESVIRAKTLLANARATTVAVLNKTRAYGPKSGRVDL